MNNPENWRVTKSQKEQIQELLGKLNWSQEFYQAGIMWPVENSTWHQAIAMISGLEFLAANPRAWKL